MRKIIIDTDTGSDDAVAILMALRDPSVQVLALTTVCGNVSLEPVSYTHLDVYKRQIWACLAALRSRAPWS